jgi:Fe-S oxidoreductase
MNPGKIVNSPPINENLRFGTAYKTPKIEAEFQFRYDGGFAGAVEMCSGVGACRKTQIGTMCPSYIATRDEEHSTRGRANALRLAISGQLGEDGLTSKRLHDVLDLCLSCKACKSECPSNVDMAKLKSEFLQKYYDKHGTTLRDRMICNSSTMSSRFSGALAPIVNGIQGTALFKIVQEKCIGIDKRRTLPKYASQTFHHWFTHRPKPALKFEKKLSSSMTPISIIMNRTSENPLSSYLNPADMKLFLRGRDVASVREFLTVFCGMPNGME